jgi:hypothetical protein
VPVSGAAADGSEVRDLDDSPSTVLTERLRAYTHHPDDVSTEPPPQ